MLKRSPIRRKPSKARSPKDGRLIADKAVYKALREAMWDRQKGLCAICLTPMRLGTETFEHERSRGMGGGMRTDEILYPDGRWRNAATCLSCNHSKGSVRYAWTEDNSRFEPVKQ